MNSATELEQDNATELKESDAPIDVKLWVTEKWQTIGQEPISKESPAGTNIRLEDDFEKIELELTKLESLTNQEPIEWGYICNWCEDILRNQSKDLLVACYLTRALCDGGVLTGLITGLSICSEIVDHFWDVCQPPKKRKKGRAAAFDWMVEKCFPLFEKYNFSVSDIDKLKALSNLLSHIDQALLAHLTDDAPSFAELQQGVRRQLGALEIEQKQSQRAKEKASAPATNAQSASSSVATSKPAASAPIATFSGAISSERDLLSCYRSNQDSLRSACEYLRTESLANPESYRINRFLTWLGIGQLPPNTNGVTQMRPPPKEKLQHYQGLIGNSKAEDLVPEVENSISRSPYWLDGHRIVHESLVEGNYAEAAAAVADGLKEFIKKFPDVVSLKFSDQTAFADEDTRRWINLEVLTESESAQASHSLPISGGDGNEWEDAYSNAMAFVKEKKLNEAFALFKDGCQRSYSKRSLAFWRFYQARFCYETQNFDLAISLLELIDKTLSSDGVESWEPEVSAKVIELLLRSYKKQPEEKIPKERVAALNERLCQFDLATAYELSTN